MHGHLCQTIFRPTSHTVDLTPIPADMPAIGTGAAAIVLKDRVLVTPDVLSGEGEQSYMSGSLHGDGQSPLMFCTRAGLATRLDLATLREKPAQGGYIFVVNNLALLQTEGTHFAPGCESPSALPSLPAISFLSVVVSVIHRESSAPFSSRVLPFWWVKATRKGVRLLDLDHAREIGSSDAGRA
jgi:hypothetical protein